MIVKIKIWNKAWEIIFNFIIGVKILASLLYGFLFKSSLLGFSVAKAKEAKESIIKLTHNISMAFKGESLRIIPPKKVINTATILVVIWNWTNFLIQS